MYMYICLSIYIYTYIYIHLYEYVLANRIITYFLFFSLYLELEAKKNKLLSIIIIRNKMSGGGKDR